MKRMAFRLAAAVLAAALTAGTAVSAAGQPEVNQALRREWSQAAASQDPEQVLQAAGQSWELLSRDGLTPADCLELEPQCALASWASEVTGELEDAMLWLERQAMCTGLLATEGEDRNSALQDLEARWSYLSAAASPSIYALTEETQDDSDADGPGAGVWYGASVGSGRTEGAAVLAGVPFQEESSMEEELRALKNASARFRRAAAEGGVVLLVWELTPESTAGVEKALSPSAERYIEESLRAMGQLEADVLLQVGTGPNGWNSCDPERYVQAFRKVALAAQDYDNIQMVFPASDVGSRGATFEDYYPGDVYVDWIGVSVSRQGGTEGYSFSDPDWQEDAYRGEGVYAADPLVRMTSCLSFAREHGKPAAVTFRVGPPSEEDRDGQRTAADQISRFYACLTMRWPQVKAVLFDDSPAPESGTRPLSDVSALSQAYRAAVAANGTYLDQGERGTASWVPLEELGEAHNTLRLACDAIFPGDGKTTITWYLDGKAVETDSQIPYVLELKAGDLTSGRHLVWITAESGQFSYNGAAWGRIYQLYAADTGLMMGENSGFQITAASDWAQSMLMDAYGRGLVTARTSENLQSPITRLAFAELAVNLIEQTTGEEIEPAVTGFLDTDDLAVRKAVAAGITSGKTEERFAPDDLITREEICVMLCRVIQYVDMIQGTTTLEDRDGRIDPAFADGVQVSPWAAESMALLTNNGLMAGKDGDRLAPGEHATVEEAIVLALALRRRF